MVVAGVWAVATWVTVAWAGAVPAGERTGPAAYRLELSDSQREKLTEQKREELIAQLERLTERFEDDSPRKPDLLFQLGEAYFEKSKALQRAEMERSSSAPADHRQSDALRAKAMAVYTRLLKGWPNYPRTDEVLFSLAYDFDEVGQKAEAVKHYRRLLKSFPRSRYAPDAWLQVGNHAFDAGQLAAAEDAYQQAFRIGAPRVRTYALYKLAWCDFNRANFAEAKSKLGQVVDGTAGGSQALLDLRTEALVDMTRVFVRLEQPEAGLDYFRRHSQGTQQRKLVTRLAEALAEAGQLDGALRVYKAALGAEPLAPEAVSWQQAVVRAYDGLHDRERVRTEVQRLAAMFHPGTPWWQANSRSTEALRSGFDGAEEALRKLVTTYHQEAQRTGAPRTYRLAADVYRAYLEAFAGRAGPQWTSDYAFNMTFYAAEIAWALGDYRAAAEQYERVMEFRIPDRPSAREVSDERLRATAAYDAVLAWDRVVDGEHGHTAAAPSRVDEQKAKGGLSNRSATAGAQAQSLTPAEQRLVAACDRYTQRFPDGKDALDIRYQAALIHFERGQTDEALRRFEQLIALAPDSDRSRQAADLTLHVLEGRGDWQALNRQAQAYAQNRGLARPGTDFAKRAVQIAEGGRYTWVSEVLHKQQHDEARAAEEFLRFAADYPTSEHAAQALTYAMVLFEQMGQLQRAVEAGQKALTQYPTTPLRLKLRHGLAHLYGQLADYRRAAEADEVFVAAYQRAARGQDGTRVEPALLREAADWVADAQLDAGIYWEAVGQSDRAAAAYAAFLKMSSGRKDASDVALAMGKLRDRESNYLEAAHAYGQAEELAPADATARRFEAAGLQLEALRRSGQTSRAEAQRQHVVKLWSGLPVATRKNPAIVAAYARASFLGAEPLFDQYTRLDFARTSTAKTDLAKKQNALKLVEKAYLDVIATGDGAQGIAALTRVGQAYADFARKVRRSPTPSGLTPEERTEYRDGLEQLAAPLEDRAVQTFQQGLGKAYELGLYSEWTLKAQDEMNSLRPGTYPPKPAVALRPPDPPLPLAGTSRSASVALGQGERR
jgi:tetratricopeptide (TPR) repeat protein